MTRIITRADERAATSGGIRDIAAAMNAANSASYVFPINVEGANLPQLFRKDFKSSLTMVQFIEMLNLDAVVDFGDFYFSGEALERPNAKLSSAGCVAFLKVVDAYNVYILFPRASDADRFISCVRQRDGWKNLAISEEEFLRIS